MTSQLRFCLLVLVLTAPTGIPTTAADRPPLDGNRLLSQCTQFIASIDSGEPSTQEAAHCIGYLQGVLQSLVPPVSSRT